MSAFSNMTKRDKNLLLLLFIVIIYYLCYTYVITPALETSSSLKIEQEQLQTDLLRAKELIGKEDELRTQSENLKQEINQKYSIYLKSLNQAQILMKMDTLMSETKFPVDGYISTETAALQVPVESGLYEDLKYPLLNMAKQVNPKIAEEKSQTEGEVIVTEGELEDMLPNSEITFSFNDATYSSMYDFIKSVEELDKTIQLKNITITGNEKNISGEIIFSLFGLPPVDENNMIDYPVTSVIPKGKANPFA